MYIVQQIFWFSNLAFVYLLYSIDFFFGSKCLTDYLIPCICEYIRNLIGQLASGKSRKGTYHAFATCLNHTLKKPSVLQLIFRALFTLQRSIPISKEGIQNNFCIFIRSEVNFIFMYGCTHMYVCICTYICIYMYMY